MLMDYENVSNKALADTQSRTSFRTSEDAAVQVVRMIDEARQSEWSIDLDKLRSTLEVSVASNGTWLRVGSGHVDVLGQFTRLAADCLPFPYTWENDVPRSQMTERDRELVDTYEPILESLLSLADRLEDETTDQAA
jgi:hypothetical protein